MSMGRVANSTFFPFTIFKSHMSSTHNLWHNFFTGFSGISTYDYFYFSLFSVWNTTLALAGLYAFDKEVKYDVN